MKNAHKDMTWKQLFDIVTVPVILMLIFEWAGGIALAAVFGSTYGSDSLTSLRLALSILTVIAFASWAGYAAVKKYGGTPFNHGLKTGAIAGALAYFISATIFIFLQGYLDNANLETVIAILLTQLFAIGLGGLNGTIGGSLGGYVANMKNASKK